MATIAEDYISFFILIFITFLISILLVFLSYVLVYQRHDFEKSSAYECGFQPFEDSREKFDVRFYLIAILFIIFDLEIMFLFPWCMTLFAINIFGYMTMLVFLIILTLGFFYEWKKGALVWS